MYNVNARNHFNYSPLLFSWPAPRNRCGQTKRGEYWQLNQDNQHSSTYSRIKRDNTQWIHRRKSYDKSTEQTEDHVPWICSPQWDLPAVHSRYTHRSSALPGGPLGVFHPCLWPLKASGSTLGEGRQTSRQPTDASTPLTLTSYSIRTQTYRAAVHAHVQCRPRRYRWATMIDIDVK